MLNYFSKFKRKGKKSRPTLETDAVPDYNRSYLNDEPAVVQSNNHQLLEEHETNNRIIPNGANSLLTVVPSSSPQANYERTSCPTPPQLSGRYVPALPQFNGYTPQSSPVSIVINNANSFHIGDAITFSLSDSATVNLSSSGLGLSSLGQSLAKKLSKSQEITPDLEDLSDVLSDADIAVIAQNLIDWKAFGRALTISESELEVTENKYPGNSSNAACDMLHSFVTLYPDTSVGFVAAILKETGQINALTLLAKNRS